MLSLLNKILYDSHEITRIGASYIKRFHYFSAEYIMFRGDKRKNMEREKEEI